MPGMDGFQAVQAIKNNPRTATIPIMMYTSQEGELYLSQARALGAIGVLPKQIKHADVSKVLDQLHLLGAPKPEHELATIQVHELPRDTAPPPDTTVERRAPNRPNAPPLPADQRLVFEGMLAHHMLDVRRFIVDSLESSADRIVGDVRLAMQDQGPPSAAAASSSARGGEWRLWLAVAAAGRGAAARPRVVAAAWRRRCARRAAREDPAAARRLAAEPAVAAGGGCRGGVQRRGARQ